MCEQKYHLNTFVIRDKIWTPPLLYKSVHVTFVFWVPKTPPTPYMSGTFVLAPPPPGKVYLGLASSKIIRSKVFLGWAFSQIIP